MTQTVSLSALFGKRESELSGGFYQRGAVVRLANRSRYNTLPASETPSLGMGIVQAVLAVLTMHVKSFAWDAQGQVGSAVLYSISKRPKNQYTYQFSWDERDPENPLYSGFEKGLTYQLAVLHIITCCLGGVYQRSERCSEAVERWFELVRACDAGYPRTSEGGWSERVIAAACRDPRVQPFIERVCDALWFAMRYQLPSKNLDRRVLISEGQVLPTQEIGRLATIRAGVGSDLLSPEWGTLVPMSTLMQQESGAPPKNTPARQARMERELSLDEQFLSTLSETRESRIVDPSPSWILPDGDDEIF